MPWNDNANPGPWGSPPPGGDGERRDPPRRPLGGGGRGPNFDPGFDRWRRRMRDAFGGPGGLRPGVIAALLGGAVLLWAASGIYFVQPNEVAVVTTFGAHTRDEGPGARYHLPSPIERVVKVPGTTLQLPNVGGTGDTDAPEESLMLTRDENIVDVDFSVAWRVSDPARFVFTVRDPPASVKAVAESAMREVVGKTDMQPIISTGRGDVQRQTAAQMQRILDAWGAGITVVEVQIRSAQPPAEVLAAFRDVQNAEQDRAAAVNEALAYKNRVVAEARGDAARITQSGEAYREQAVRIALGDAARFNSIYNEYRRAPGATRDRLFIETMERVLGKSNKVIVDGKGTTAPIILPPDVFRPKAQAQAQPQQPPIPQAQNSPQDQGGRARQ
jgi:membrane protease subunit HflK